VFPQVKGLLKVRTLSADAFPCAPESRLFERSSVNSWQRALTFFVFILLVIATVFLRYELFAGGILYGEAASKMASLAVAGVIILCGYLPLRMLRGHEDDQKDDPQVNDKNSTKDASRETIAATLAAVLGLALTGYSVSELLAPNTPVSAVAPACDGTPVYGAVFFAKTQANGVNARSGPGVEYPQVNRYGGNCTLGFDGYCIGRAVPDFLLKTPDQRWLIIHDRDEMVASGVVLSESAESALGANPSPKCKKLGGLPEPTNITNFSYDPSSGQIRSVAPGAVAVGYGMASVPSKNRAYQVIALGRAPDFVAELKPSTIVSEISVIDGVWLSAAVCLADNVPVVESLRVQLLTFRGSQIIKEQPNSQVPKDTRSLLAEVACNSSGL